MHKHYIINNIVEFHPAASTLRDINNPDRVVVLNSPAGRCLLLLIDRAGSIVTQQEFLDIVWQSRGMLVSSNTYYQNISILRKGLKKIGFETDPIVTIPRIGLTLASDTQITVRESSPVTPQPAEGQCVEAPAIEEVSASSAPAAPVAEAHALAGCRHGAIGHLAGAGVTGYMSARKTVLLRITVLRHPLGPVAFILRTTFRLTLNALPR